MDSFKRNFQVGLDQKIHQVNGLTVFKNSIEKEFFSSATVNYHSSSSTTINIAIEITANFSLTECLYYLKKGATHNHKKKATPFFKALSSLRDKNDLSISIEELSLTLNDTTIIITKIYENSIEDYLEDILYKLTTNKIHYTKELKEVPFEIYIPIFEESSLTNGSPLNAITTKNNDYSGFWGLYFDSEENAAVYDVKNKSIVKGDLFLLNH
ncbi:MAG: hypothetical protein V3U92_12325 [Cellulophaga sp.]